MIAVWFLLSIIAQVSQQMCRKEYNKKTGDLPFSFSFVGVLAGLLYFAVLSGGRFAFSWELVPYVIPFAVCYTVAYVCTIYAIAHGPLSLTSLMISCSVIVPLLYGVIFLKEPVGLALILGLVLLLSSIVLVSEPRKKEGVRITPKWIAYVCATFLSNGLCMTVQKLFQIRDSGMHSNEFMIGSLLITALVLLIFLLVRERDGLKKALKTRSVLWPILCGAGNGIANRLTMMLAVMLPASFLYPIQSAGTILLTAAVSVFLYKEKLSSAQKLGFLCGVFAIAVFNL